MAENLLNKMGEDGIAHAVFMGPCKCVGLTRHMGSMNALCGSPITSIYTHTNPFAPPYGGAVYVLDLNEVGSFMI